MKSGMIAVHKPEGVSSARVVARVKKKLGAKKVGHTGTLDPFATGLLLCAVNKATKISQFFLHGNKQYTARVCLGIETDTQDKTGTVLAQAPPEKIKDLSVTDILAAVRSFKGQQLQVPPAFSALKHEGTPLYKLARQGKTVTKPPREIEIFKIGITRAELPYIDIDVACSSGTYIRTIAYDLGKKLGCGAHLSRLCRTGSGKFDLEDAIALDTFENLDQTLAQNVIIPMSDCLDFLPKIVVDENTAARIRHGQKLAVSRIQNKCDENEGTIPGKGYIRVMDESRDLLAVVQLSEDKQTYNYSCVFST